MSAYFFVSLEFSHFVYFACCYKFYVLYCDCKQKSLKRTFVVKGGDDELLTQNEQRVLALIEKDPFLTQQEIASQLDLPRSTVATIVSSLTNKKQLLGRAYIVNHGAEIFCIGGMNIDRKYLLEAELMPKTSNPVTSSMSVGGVARNISENLGRLGLNVNLLSIGGRDQDFETLKQATEPFVNFQHVTQLGDYSTGSYVALLDDDGDMELALADMSVADTMNREWISSYQNLLVQAKMIVLDLNVPLETTEYIIELARNKDIPLVIIPVSSPKMAHLPRQLEGVKWIIVNLDESETFFNKKVETAEDVEELVESWLALGVENVIITRGQSSTFYGNQTGERKQFLPPVSPHVEDVTGAGDSYASGLIYGQLQGYSPMESIQLAITNAYYTIQSPKTVRLDLTQDNLEKQTEELKERGII